MVKIKLYFRVFWIGYFILTIIKFFTGIVQPIGGTTVYLVAKVYPTINNVWILGEETVQNIARIKGTWYYEGKYLILASGENGVLGENLHWLLVKIWWIITLALCFALLVKIKRYTLNR